MLTFPHISEVFYTGSQPGSCLARTHHHSPNSSEISWKAPCFPSALSPPAQQLLFPPALAAAPRAIPLPPCPARRCHNLTALTLAAGAPRALSLLQCTSASAGASCIPRQNQGPLARVEACEDMVSCLAEIPSSQTRACRAKHSCKWHSEPREARL